MIQFNFQANIGHFVISSTKEEQGTTTRNYSAGGPREISKSRNLPSPSSYTHPWTTTGFKSLPPPVNPHASRMVSDLMRFSTCAFTFASTTIGSASGSGTALILSAPTSRVRGSSQRFNGCWAGRAGMVAIAPLLNERSVWLALRHAPAPPHSACPTTMTTGRHN